MAIDFETANSGRASACSIGLTKVKDGKIVDSKYELFQPPVGFDHFEMRNVAIHGINAKDVKSKKRFIEYWPDIYSFTEGLPLVAHNASFDISVLRATLSASDEAWPELKYACTYVISKNLFDMARHRLPDVAIASGVDWDEKQHHDALFDSRVCAEVVLALSVSRGSSSLDTLMESLDLSFGTLHADGWRSSRSKKAISKSHHTKGEKTPFLRSIGINDDADPAHPFFGKVVVFTGSISIPRSEAWQLVANVGAIPKDGLTKKTNYLVLGEQDLSKLKPGESKSGKQREAEVLKAAGSDIEIIDERDFFSLLEPEEWRVDRLIESKYE